MNYSEINIKELIPQREPMIQIDSVKDLSENMIKTSFLIRNDNIFIENQKFNESGLVENMAQTAASLNGLRARINNTEVRIGYIGSVNDLNIIKLPDVNTEIHTTVIEETNLLNASIVKASIFINKDLAAECRLKIFLM